MNQIPIKTTCRACGGEGVLTNSKIFTLADRDYPLLSKCTACEGKGTQLTWVDVRQLDMLLHAIATEKDAE
jgi:hypothetical protein